MGLLPKQHSTGGKARLSGISKRGNCYLRKILIHGARAVVCDRSETGSRWEHGSRRSKRRAPRNVLIVAMANKLARIAGRSLDGTGLPAVPDNVTA